MRIHDIESDKTLSNIALYLTSSEAAELAGFLYDMIRKPNVKHTVVRDRELEHGLEHAFVVCNRRIIERNHLPEEIRDYVSMSRSPLPYPTPRRKSLTARLVRQALEQSRWNKTKAAQLLGIDRSTVYRKIKQYHLHKKSGMQNNEG